MQKINKLPRYVAFWRPGIIKAAKPFYVNGLFLYPLETSENRWFSDVSRGYRKRPLT